MRLDETLSFFEEQIGTCERCARNSPRFDAANLWAHPYQPGLLRKQRCSMHFIHPGMLAHGPWALRGAAACNACDSCPARAGDMTYCLLGGPVLTMHCAFLTFCYMCAGC